VNAPSSNSAVNISILSMTRIIQYLKFNFDTTRNFTVRVSASECSARSFTTSIWQVVGRENKSTRWPMTMKCVVHVCTPLSFESPFAISRLVFIDFTLFNVKLEACYVTIRSSAYAVQCNGWFRICFFNERRRRMAVYVDGGFGLTCSFNFKSCRHWSSAGMTWWE